MSENQGKTVVEIDAEEIKKPGWEHGKASGGQLPGHGGVDIGKVAVKPTDDGVSHGSGWNPGQAGTYLAYGSGALGREGDFEAANKITEALLAAAETERLKREGK